MQIVTTLTESPGDCAICRSTRPVEHLDTGIEYRRGRLYLCQHEFTPAQWEALKLRLEPEPELIHIPAEAKFACPQCADKVFDSQNALNGHVTAHKKRGDWKGEA